MSDKIISRPYSKEGEEAFDRIFRNKKIISQVVRYANGMVTVTDVNGEQLPEFQGMYENVKEKILSAAPDSAVFKIGVLYEGEFPIVARDKW